MVLSICYPVFRTAKRVAISFPSIVYLHLLFPFTVVAVVPVAVRINPTSLSFRYRHFEVSLRLVRCTSCRIEWLYVMWSNSRSLVSFHLLVVHGKRLYVLPISSPRPSFRFLLFLRCIEDASTVWWLQLLCTSCSSVSNLPKTWGNKLRGSHSAGDEDVCKVTNYSSTSSASGLADGNRVEQTSCSLFLSASLLPANYCWCKVEEEGTVLGIVKNVRIQSFSLIFWRTEL